MLKVVDNDSIQSGIEYGSKGTSLNLMDYGKGTSLNLMR